MQNSAVQAYRIALMILQATVLDTGFAKDRIADWADGDECAYRNFMTAAIAEQIRNEIDMK